LSVTVASSNDVILASGLDESLIEYANAAERTKVDKLALNQDLLELRGNGQFALTINLHMVWFVQDGDDSESDEEVGDDYIGCRLRSGGQALYSF
jgi:hypothetical protein